MHVKYGKERMRRQRGTWCQPSVRAQAFTVSIKSKKVFSYRMKFALSEKFSGKLTSILVFEI